MDNVWVIETGDYEQRHVCGVAASIEAAAEFIKRPYVAPYVVQWDRPKQIHDDEWTLVGHFSRVDGYCVDGPTEWTITRYALIAAQLEQSP